jgi:hypothetical protein
LYSLEELNKVGIAYSFTFLYVEKTFKDLKEDITKLSTIIKKSKSIKRVEIKETYQHEDQINRVRNGKLPYNFNKEANSNEYCQYCHKNGHTTDNCFFNPSNSPNNNYRGEKKNINNKSRNKIKIKRTSLNRKGSKRNFKSYNVNYEEQNNSNSDSDPSFDFCFNIKTNCVKDNFNNSSITSRNIRVNKVTTEILKEENNIMEDNNIESWIIDSGTGINLSKNIKILSNIEEVANRGITYPNGQSDRIYKKGMYKGMYKNNNFSIGEVFYAPNIQNNLISTHYLCKKGFKLVMDMHNNKERLQIFKNNKLITTVYTNDENLFTLNTSSMKNKDYNINNVDLKLWHARLGHYYNQNLQKFLENNNIKEEKNDNINCEDCKISKLKKKPFNKTINKSSSPLQVVHSDIVGPLKPSPSFSGYKYYITFIDDFSRKCWVYLLKHKSEAVQKFIEFHKLMKNTCNYNVKEVRSDNGLEYNNSNFINYLKNNGIIFNHSTPGNPQQNGRAERINQTLDNCAKTLLSAAKLSPILWDEAIKCACILYNLNPHQEINFKILNEVFFNKKIDISKLKVFGCKVFFLKRYKQGKFENNTKPGIFLGYSSDSPGYRVLDITSKTIIIVRDAYFN